MSSRGRKTKALKQRETNQTNLSRKRKTTASTFVNSEAVESDGEETEKEGGKQQKVGLTDESESDSDTGNQKDTIDLEDDDSDIAVLSRTRHVLGKKVSYAPIRLPILS